MATVNFNATKNTFNVIDPGFSDDLELDENTLLRPGNLPNEIWCSIIAKYLRPEDTNTYVDACYEFQAVDDTLVREKKIELFEESLRGYSSLDTYQFERFLKMYNELRGEENPVNPAEFLTLFRNLRKLELKREFGTPETLNALQYLPHLKSLTLATCYLIEDLSFLKHTPSLTSLRIANCRRINDLSLLRHVSQLKTLELARMGQLTGLSFLEHLPQLSTLKLIKCRGIQDFSDLQHLPQLKSLTLGACKQIEEFSFLQDLPHLETLDLSYCTQLQDLSLLKHIPQLKTLILEGFHQLQDISILEAHPNLQVIPNFEGRL